MGCNYSCESSTAIINTMDCSYSCKSSTATINNIRVVHLNGFVEDFEDPVTVSYVTGKPTNHFMCTQAQLLSPAFKPLKPEAQLEPGRIYFLLPYTMLRSDVSPVDLASVARRLTAKAKTNRPEPKSTQSNISADSQGANPIWGSPARSPNRFGPMVDQVQNNEPSHGMQKSTKSRSWRPILTTIREISFNRRSESDLQEKHSETPK